MPYRVLFTATKEASTPWFFEIYPNELAAINQFTNSQPGFFSAIKTKITSTYMEKVYTFDTKENYDAFINALDKNSNEVKRKAYNAANNIINTRQQI